MYIRILSIITNYIRSISEHNICSLHTFMKHWAVWRQLSFFSFTTVSMPKFFQSCLQRTIEHAHCSSVVCTIDNTRGWCVCSIIRLLSWMRPYLTTLKFVLCFLLHAFFHPSLSSIKLCELNSAWIRCTSLFWARDDVATMEFFGFLNTPSNPNSILYYHVVVLRVYYKTNFFDDLISYSPAKGKSIHLACE